MAQLQDLFQTHAIVKILDHLTLYKGFEYTKTDIVNETGISRRTLYEVWSIIERFDLVKITKSSGKIKFYKLNTENPISKQLVALADKISFFEAERIASPKTKTIPQVDLPTYILSSENQKPEETTDDMTIQMRALTIKGTPSQFKKLFEKELDLTNGEMKFPVTDSTMTEPVGKKKNQIIRVQFQDGKPIKLVVEK